MLRAVSSNVLNSKPIAQTRYSNNVVCNFIKSPKFTCSKFKPQSSKFATLNQWHSDVNI